MLVGGCGSGKSTLVNAIVNYITDVSFADDFRFDITYEEQSNSVGYTKDAPLSLYHEKFVCN